MVAGIPESEIDSADTAKLLGQWEANYDPNKRIPGMTFARQRYFQRVNASIAGLLSTEGAIIAAKDAETGDLQETETVPQSAYANISEVANVRCLLYTSPSPRDRTRSRMPSSA